MVTVADPNSSSPGTAMLGVSKSDKKIPACVVFANEATAGGRVVRECHDPVQHGHSMRMTHVAQENAWMDKKCLIIWVERGTGWKGFGNPMLN